MRSFVIFSVLMLSLAVVGEASAARKVKIVNRGPRADVRVERLNDGGCHRGRNANLRLIIR